MFDEKWRKQGLKPLYEARNGEHCFVIDWLFFQIGEQWYIVDDEAFAEYEGGTLDCELVREGTTFQAIKNAPPQRSHSGYAAGFTEGMIKAFPVDFHQKPKPRNDHGRGGIQYRGN